MNHRPHALRMTVAVLALLAIGGCQTLGLQTPANPQQAVFALKATLFTITKTATNYTSLPRCPYAGVCSDQAAVDTIVKSIVSADAAVEAAEMTVRDPVFNGDPASATIVAAENSVTALQKILATLGVSQ